MTWRVVVVPAMDVGSVGKEELYHSQMAKVTSRREGIIQEETMDHFNVDPSLESIVNLIATHTP